MPPSFPQPPAPLNTAHARCPLLRPLAASATKGWAFARLRPRRAPPRALRALGFALEAAALIIPQITLTMSSIEAVPVFLLLLLVWGSLVIKIWTKLLRAPAAKAQVAAVAQQLAEPRKRCVLAAPH